MKIKPKLSNRMIFLKNFGGGKSPNDIKTRFASCPLEGVISTRGSMGDTINAFERFLQGN